MKNSRQLAGLFIAGVRDLKDLQSLKPFLKDYPVSGIALFNAPKDSADYIWKDTQEGMEILFEFVQNIRPRVSFLAVDQEGGRVRRLRGSFINLPSAEQISNFYLKKNRPDQIYTLYQLAARQLAQTGIHLNFAPVCDLREEYSNPSVIGDRSFGNSMDTVVSLCRTFCEAFENEDVHTTIKHLPGHGSSEEDSHDKIAVLKKTKEEIKQTDFKVFQKTAAFSSAAITAHISFSNEPKRIFSIDKDLVAEFRKELPTHLRFITDDLSTMKAVNDKKPWIQCLEAGYDYLLLCGSLDQTASSIEECIRHTEKNLSETKDQLEMELKLKHDKECFFKSFSEMKFGEWKKEIEKLKTKADEITDSIRQCS